MNTHYVYFYIRDNHTPYYVGKGKGKRAYQSHQKHGIITPKDKTKIVIVKENISELESIFLERYYIRWFGRKNINTGILHNKTDGGEGLCGNIPWNKGKPSPHKGLKRSQKVCDNIRNNKLQWYKTNKGIKHKETISGVNAIMNRPGAKEKVSKAQSGRKHSITHVDNHRLSITKYQIKTPHGIFPSIKDAVTNLNMKRHQIYNNIHSNRKPDWDYIPITRT